MKFCSTCGESVSLAIPDGDNRERYVCDTCHEIHYQNPKRMLWGACSTGRVRFYCVKELLNRATVIGRYRQDSWRTMKL